jgi:ribosomal protein L7Ae-like RNA K-turn-binding protein
MSEAEAPGAGLSPAARRKVLGLVGLGVRGRLVVVGVEKVREQARKGGLALAIVATDVSRHSLDKVVPILKAKRVVIIEWPSAAELGAVAGRESTAAVGIVDQALARGIRDAVVPVPEGGPDDIGDAARDAQRRKG